MPTGYTAAIADGITFREFVLRCARAFGASVTMRDEPTDAPIPERFEPSEWYAQRAQAASRRLDELAALRPEDAEARAESDYRERAAEREQRVAQTAALRAKYEAMLAEVNAWEPPTPDHVELKRFMGEQIAESLRFDCWAEWVAPRRLTGDEWLALETERARHDLENSEKHHAEEVERTEKRNAWLKALRESLKGGK